MCNEINRLNIKCPIIEIHNRPYLLKIIKKRVKNAKIILQKLQIIDLFQIVVDGNMVEKSKPHPEVFLKAAQFLKINPSDCVVFEDSQAGIQAALNAGMKNIGIGSSDLLNCNAHIQSFEKYNLKKLSTQINN